MSVPILITCFVRAEKLVEIIKPLLGVSNPIYVVIDAPRNKVERLKVSEVQKVLDNSELNIREILTFSQNQGTNSVALGVDWVLQDFDSVIVIEEDIYVSAEFILFAENMLRKYSVDQRVGSITAMNLVPKNQITSPDSPFRFSCYFYAWGWATWRDRWNQMIPVDCWDIDSLPTPITSRNPLAQQRWKERMREVYSGRAPGLWDYRWIYTYWEKGWLTIVPNVNLALNLGFDIEATHTKKKPSWAPNVIEKLPHLREVVDTPKQDIKADKWSARQVHNTYWLTLVKTKTKQLLMNWID
jgi:hypothetical protein